MPAKYINWDDGTNDQFVVTCTGTTGEHPEFVTSVPNLSVSQRTKTVAFKSPSGDTLEILTVVQQSSAPSLKPLFHDGYLHPDDYLFLTTTLKPPQTP